MVGVGVVTLPLPNQNNHTMTPLSIFEENHTAKDFRRTVAENIFTSQSIAQLAAECGLCSTKFKKEFKRIFGDTPHSWFVRKRLDIAARMLENTDWLVKTVADKTQFSTSSHFIRQFKAEFGLTPIEYRKLHARGPREICPLPSCGTCAATIGQCCCNRICAGQCPNKHTSAGRPSNQLLDW